MKNRNMVKVAVVMVLTVFISLMGLQAFACGIEGTAMRTDGSKVDRSARVSTSWNSKDAYPEKGYYTLELGSNACGESVEVYVNGTSIGRYHIPNSGNATVNITLKGSTDVPVR